MLPNQLTINDGTTDLVYDRISDGPTKGGAASLYICKANHVSEAQPDSLQLSSTKPRPNGDSFGVLRPETKFRFQVTVKNAAGEDVTRQLIYTLVGSIPVGASPAVEEAVRKRIASWISNTEHSDFVQYQEV